MTLQQEWEGILAGYGLTLWAGRRLWLLYSPDVELISNLERKGRPFAYSAKGLVRSNLAANAERWRKRHPERARESNRKWREKARATCINNLNAAVVSA
jgi:hypothetical protein